MNRNATRAKDARRASLPKNKQITLTLPQLFPSMTRPDWVTIQEWKYGAGDVLPLDPEQVLLVALCVRGEARLQIPDFLEGPHRIVEILADAGTTLHLDDPLFVLEPVESAA